MLSCWCGNSDLITFSSDYLRCSNCETLVSKRPFPQSGPKVIDDQHDFYGYQYWFEYQEKDLGLPNIAARARTDLPERCLHWLRTTLQYKLPPARVLELGSAHGGFVALLRWAGFDAVGLEMSPHIVDFSSKTFNVPILLGPVEDQHVEPDTLDMILLMDVLEHLPDPVGTLGHCLTLLKTEGLLVIQTPLYQERKTYEEILSQDDPFLELLKETGHLYLFSPTSIRMFFQRLGVEHFEFEPAIFAHYDMFLVLSRSPLNRVPSEEIEKALSSSPSGRMIQALSDIYLQKQKLLESYSDIYLQKQKLLESYKASEADLTTTAAQLEQLKRLPEVRLRRKLSGLWNK